MDDLGKNIHIRTFSPPFVAKNKNGLALLRIYTYARATQLLESRKLIRCLFLFSIEI